LNEPIKIENNFPIQKMMFRKTRIEIVEKLDYRFN